MVEATTGDSPRASVRIGWEILIRAHGVQVPRKLGITANFVDDPHEAQVLLDLTAAPPYAVRIETPKYYVIGEPVIQISALVPAAPTSGWLALVVTRSFEIDGRLAQAFLADPDDHQVTDELNKLFASEFEELRAMADLCAGAVVLGFPKTHPALWHDAKQFWRSDTRRDFITVAPPVTALSASTTSPEYLGELSGLMHAMCGLKGRIRVAVQLCSRWLIIAHGLAVGADERFMICFQCLEALVSLRDQAPLEADTRAMSHLLALAAASPEDASAEALAFLSRQRERILKPSFTERFRRLASRLAGESAAEDVRQLRSVNSARNSYIHARTASVPTLLDGVDVHRIVHDLAVKYLRLLVAEELGQPASS